MGRWGAAWAALAVAACADPSGRVGQGPEAIIGGTSTAGDPQVFALMEVFQSGPEVICSATLIGPRTLITAAHCVYSGGSFMASNAALPERHGERYRVVETRLHPGYGPSQPFEFDVALLLLERAPPIPPKPWRSTPLNLSPGMPVRLAGYGATVSSGAGTGEKRIADTTVVREEEHFLWIGETGVRGICFGDSGGPTFHTYEDQVEWLVGVHSFGTGKDCLDGADVRVDRHLSFIDQWLADKESPTCQPDHRCQPGCVPEDADCYCLADGSCDPRCLHPEWDLDCPQHCGADGVCALSACPQPDPDCQPIGGRCDSSLACPSRRCVSDGQHPERYCSRTCQVDGDCRGDMQCVRGTCLFVQLPVVANGMACEPGKWACESLSVCTGTSDEPLRCWPACGSDQDCAPEQRCLQGANGHRYCRDLPPVQVPHTPPEPPADPGCGTTPHGAWIVSAAVAWWALFRRRGFRGGNNPRRW